MLTNHQVRKLMKLLTAGEPLEVAAMRAGMDPKSARRYREAGRLPSEIGVPHTWRTRQDPFAEAWEEMLPLLEVNPGLQATTLFVHLQRQCPGRFADGQLRCLQRKVKQWRATEGPAREVFFPQRHYPGDLGASDFCHLSDLGVRIAERPFAHLLYHFTLTYSNWETGSVCFAESFESLSEGLQQALFELGGVPKRHRTDSLTAAVHRPTADHRRQFTDCYQALLSHYGLAAQAINPGRANENGDVEGRHHRFKVALDQQLMLRGSREFESRAEYTAFLQQLFDQLNAGRRERLQQEMALLRSLPATRLDACKRLRVRVGPSSTIAVQNNTYSVHSRLIGEWVEARLWAEQLEVWYGQKRVDAFPRMRGRGGHRIEYRHVIDWLVRKPGAFANYRYRDDLFPTSRFRIAYDTLVARSQVENGQVATREYLAILQLAARESEARVDEGLRALIDSEEPISAAAVRQHLQRGKAAAPAARVTIAPVDLAGYDRLLGGAGLLAGCVEREAA